MDEINTRLQDLRRLLDAARHRKRYYREHVSLLKLPEVHLKLVLCATALSERGSGAAGLLWRYCQRLRRYSSGTLQELEEMAHTHHLARDTAYMTELLYTEEVSSQRLVIKAARFVAEVELYLWVTRCNSVQGVAPQASAVLRHYITLPIWHLVLMVSNHGRQIAGASFWRQILWLHDFRKRWGCAVQRLKVENVLEPAELQRKARPTMSELTSPNLI